MTRSLILGLGGGDKQTQKKQTDIGTYRLNRSRGQFSEKSSFAKVSALGLGLRAILRIQCIKDTISLTSFKIQTREMVTFYHKDLIKLNPKA